MLVLAALTLVAAVPAGAAEDDALPSTEELPFAEPPEFRSEGGRLEVTLTAVEAEVELSGTTVRALTFDGAFPGPTLRVRPGDRLEVNLVNDLDEPTNLSFMGLRVPVEDNANNAFTVVEPGQPFLYVLDIPDDHPPGTFWYSSHIHSAAPGRASDQVLGGLAGAIVIEGLTDLLPPAEADIEERLLVLQDVQVRDGVLVRDAAERGRSHARTVNGMVNPRLTIAPGERQLWRLVNAGSNDFFHLSLDGHDFQVLAEDGNPVSALSAEDSLVLPPGKRYDVLIQGAAPRDYGLRTLAYDQGAVQYAERVLATLESSGDLRTQEGLPESFAAGPDLSNSPVFGQREVVLGGDGESGFTIDGEPYDPDRTDHQAVLGTVEDWTVRNDTAEQHVFHLHLTSFQVLSIDGEPVDARSLQDTVVVPAGGEAVVRIPFERITGRSVFQCHITAHHTAGLMAAIEVVREPGDAERGIGAPGEATTANGNPVLNALLFLTVLFAAVGGIVYLLARRRRPL